MLCSRGGLRSRATKLGTTAQTYPLNAGRFSWFGEFLRYELAPYRGRIALVARMVTASTLVMLIGFTFKIPSTALAALFTLIISRESRQATEKTVRGLLGVSVFALVYVVGGGMLVLGNELLRFCWVAATLFLVFFGIGTIRNYGATTIFGFVSASAIPVFDAQIPAGAKIEGTLWSVAAIPLGSLVTLLIEEVFAAMTHSDDLTAGLSERLTAVEDLLESYAENGRVSAGASADVRRLASVGTSGIRRNLHRSTLSSERKDRLSALLGLTARLVDLGANLPEFPMSGAPDDRARARDLAVRIADVRQAIVSGTPPRLPGADMNEPPHHPLRYQMRKTVSLMHEVLIGTQSTVAFSRPIMGGPGANTFFFADAFSNPEHLKFAIRGCLAASLSYVIYNALFWPGISTAITTCVVTALTTVGASHQKQFLRFSGVLVGGAVLGMGAQIFILPYMDSISGFALLFVFVTAIAAWFATASARLSYFGVQLAFGFYFVHLIDFRFQTSLATARDRVVGVLLGLSMMWLVFDVLWSASAGVEMKKAFISGIRLLARFTRGPVSGDRNAALADCYLLRDRIDAQFERVRSMADGVLFEFGPSRQQDLALRNSIRKWQPELRTFFLMRVAATQYRLQFPGFELPEQVRVWQQQIDERHANALDRIASWVEGEAPPDGDPGLTELDSLTSTLAPPVLVDMMRGMERITNSLAGEVARSVGS